MVLLTCNAPGLQHSAHCRCRLAIAINMPRMIRVPACRCIAGLPPSGWKECSATRCSTRTCCLSKLGLSEKQVCQSVQSSTASEKHVQVRITSNLQRTTQYYQQRGQTGASSLKRGPCVRTSAPKPTAWDKKEGVPNLFTSKGVIGSMNQ